VSRDECLRNYRKKTNGKFSGYYKWGKKANDAYFAASGPFCNTFRNTSASCSNLAAFRASLSFSFDKTCAHRREIYEQRRNQVLNSYPVLLLQFGKFIS
jgi:hypothetical protein